MDDLIRDLIEQLQAWSDLDIKYHHDARGKALHQAANEIERLTAELRTLRAERDAALAGVSEKCRHTSDRNRAATALKGSTDAACGTLGDSDGDDGA